MDVYLDSCVTSCADLTSPINERAHYHYLKKTQVYHVTVFSSSEVLCWLLDSFQAVGVTGHCCDNIKTTQSEINTGNGATGDYK